MVISFKTTKYIYVVEVLELRFALTRASAATYMLERTGPAQFLKIFGLLEKELNPLPPLSL